jgi:signal peptidase
VLSAKVSRAVPSTAAAARLLKRLLHGAFVVVLVAMIAALSAAVAPRLFGYYAVTVRGGSMNETLPNGSLVIAGWLAADEVELGDVILIQSESDDGPVHPRFHRVVSLEEEGGQILVTTKGDANAPPDPYIDILPARVLTPAYSLPYLGHLVTFAMTPLGWALLVALPAAALCASILRSIWAGKERPAANPTKT